MLITKGFDAGQPIVYLSTDVGQPLTAVLERATYVPALNDASCNGCDDFLGSARERLFAFVNGQTGVNNPNAQGFAHFAKDGPASENAVQANTAFINAMRYGGDVLNVFGEFPTLTHARNADGNVTGAHHRGRSPGSTELAEPGSERLRAHPVLAA